MRTKQIEICPGNTIDQACKEAATLARFCHKRVRFDFCGVWLVATPRSNPDDLVKRYRATRSRRRRKYLNSTEHRRHEEAQMARKKQQEHQLALLLTNTPARMSLKDPAGWATCQEANQDLYGQGILTYADRWARCMEARMANGESGWVMARTCSRLANTEGISGFMHQAALHILRKVWMHGEALSEWFYHESPNTI